MVVNVALKIEYPSISPTDTFEFVSVMESNRNVRASDPTIVPMGGGNQEAVVIYFLDERIFNVDMTGDKASETDNALAKAEDFADFVGQQEDETNSYKLTWTYSTSGWNKVMIGKITNVSLRYISDTFLTKIEGITINFYRDDVD